MDNHKENQSSSILNDPLIFTSPHAIITMESGDTMAIKLHNDVAPISVENFISLASKGFYDGLIFHRVIKNFMIQGGDPTGTGTGGPGHSIIGEFGANKIENDISHVKGVLSMARSNDYNSAGSQFFIVHKASPHLDGSYAAFGMLVDGFEVLDCIASVDTDHQDRPKVEQKIRSVVIVDGYNK